MDLALEELNSENGCTENSSTLLSIDLRSLNLGEQGILTLATAIQSTNCSNIRLYLGGNNITHEGAEAIGDIIKSRKCCLISLRGNIIGDKGVKIIRDAFSSGGRCREISLYNNKISQEGAKVITDIIKLENRPDWIDLAFNQIGIDGLEAIRDAIETTRFILAPLGLNLGSSSDKEREIKAEIDCLLKSSGAEKNNLIESNIVACFEFFKVMNSKYILPKELVIFISTLFIEAANSKMPSNRKTIAQFLHFSAESSWNNEIKKSYGIAKYGLICNANNHNNQIMVKQTNIQDCLFVQINFMVIDIDHGHQLSSIELKSEKLLMVFNSPEAAKLFQFHYCEKGELVSPYFFDFDNKTAVQLNEKKQIDDFF